MTTLQLSRSLRSPVRNSESRVRREVSHPAAVSAERVKETLLEIAFVLHATRVVGRREKVVLPKKG